MKSGSEIGEQVGVFLPLISFHYRYTNRLAPLTVRHRLIAPLVLVRGWRHGLPGLGADTSSRPCQRGVLGGVTWLGVLILVKNFVIVSQFPVRENKVEIGF